MKNWVVKESDFNKAYLRKYESIMCQGNGYMGIRASAEESYEKTLRYALVAGTFDKAEALNTTELPNFADVMAVSVIADGIPMSLTEENTEGYERTLSLNNGLLERKFIWSPKEGLRLEFCSKRFVALEELHVIGQKVTVKVLEGKTVLGLKSGINGEGRYGEPHFIESQGIEEDGIMQLAEKTHESGITFAVSSAIKAWMNNDKENDVEMAILPEEKKVMASCEVALEAGQVITFEKLSRVATTRDKDINIEERASLLAHEKEEMKKLCERGYEAVWTASEEVWKNLWTEKDVVITGDADYDQLSVRFAIYHLTVMAPLHDNRMNIGAKGLSGQGYWGHTFWDTEMYMLPFFTWTDPKGARSLMEYRYNCLDAMRKESKETGYEGAKVPWEAAWITDVDTCPKKHFTQLEIHSTADVAYGVYSYYEITHDIDFMRKYGCELIFETAQYWKSRVEYNAEKDIYEICNVIGPDEYTHHADNNAYTNYLAHLNFQLALEWKERLEKEFPEDYARLNGKLNLESRVPVWEERMNKLYLPVPNEDNILPQDTTYLTLPEIDISIYRRGEKKLREDYPYPTYTRLKVSKQADVMNLFLLLEEKFSDEVKRASLAYYEPYCVHESSLSLCAYSMLAADCGEYERSYELFKGARDIDLNLEKDSEHGIHAASLGGIWQCCVLGFAGLRMCGGKIRIVPNLPRNWESVTFRVWWRGTQMEVTVTKENVEVKTLQGEKILEL